MAETENRLEITGGDVTNPYAVRTLERGLRILACFDTDNASRSLSELAECAGLHKATCFRLVRTLEAEGYLALDGASGQYHLGATLVRVALLAVSHSTIARLARPFLAALTEATGETVDMTTWTNDGPLLVDRSLTSGAFHPRNTVGQLLLDPGTTHSQIWLAFGPPAHHRRALALLSGTGGAQPGTAADLEREIEATRREGYAFDVSEERGVSAVGAPVWNASGEMIACVSVVSPYAQPRPEAMERQRLALLQTASALSGELGYRPRPD